MVMTIATPAVTLAENLGGSLTRNPEAHRGLKALRQAHGWSQEHIARQASVSLSTVRLIEGGSRRCSPDTAAKIAALFGVEVELLWPTASDVPGVLVTLAPEYRDYAIRDGRNLHRRFRGQQRFGHRTEGDRIASSGARRAVEQHLGADPGKLGAYGLDAISTRNLSPTRLHIRPEHSGRIYAVAGPIEGVEAMLSDEGATFLVLGSLDVDAVRDRDPEGHPPAVIVELSELDPPTGRG